MVEGYLSSDQGRFDLQVECGTDAGVPTRPPNDMPFEDAVVLATDVACSRQYAGTTTGGVVHVGSPSPEAYYRFELFETTRVEIDTCGSAYDTWLLLFTDEGFVPGGSPLLSNDDHSSSFCLSGTGGRTDSGVASTLAAGVYYVVVEGYAGAAGNFVLRVNCVTATTPPSSPPTQPQPTIDVGYTRRTIGNCNGHCYIETIEDCAAAAAAPNLNLDDVTPNRDDSTGVVHSIDDVFAVGSYHPLGCCKDSSSRTFPEVGSPCPFTPTLPCVTTAKFTLLHPPAHAGGRPSLHPQTSRRAAPLAVGCGSTHMAT